MKHIKLTIKKKMAQEFVSYHWLKPTQKNGEPFWKVEPVAVGVLQVFGLCWASIMEKWKQFGIDREPCVLSPSTINYLLNLELMAISARRTSCSLLTALDTLTEDSSSHSRVTTGGTKQPPNVCSQLTAGCSKSKNYCWPSPCSKCNSLVTWMLC